MKWYQFEVTETVKKTVWVEANSMEEAEAAALDEDMEKNFDCLDRSALLLEVDYEDH